MFRKENIIYIYFFNFNNTTSCSVAYPDQLRLDKRSNIFVLSHSANAFRKPGLFQFVFYIHLMDNTCILRLRFDQPLTKSQPNV